MGLRIGFHVSDNDLVTIHRDPDVTETQWYSVFNLFTSSHRGETAEYLVISLDGFLSGLSALADTAKRLAIPVSVNGPLNDLIRRLGQEARQRQEILRESTSPMDPDALRKMLRDTRFTRNLREFQLRDLARLLQLPHGANFSVPGAGKTSVALALYELLHQKQEARRLLVVAPLSAFGAWREVAWQWFAPPLEIEAYLGGEPPKAEVLLVNYHRLANQYEWLSRWVQQEPTHVILDEAHRVKRGRDGVHGAAVLDLAIHASRRDVLTGTPAPQAASDLIPIFDFLWPGQALQILPKEIQEDGVRDGLVQKIAERIRPLFVRTNKKELDLPRTTFNVELVDMAPLQASIYDALLGQFLGQLDLSSKGRHQLRELGRISMYLIEAATNPLLLPSGSSDEDFPAFQHPPVPIEPGSDLWELFQKYGRHETPGKIKACLQLARDVAKDGKVLVWTTFRRNISILERMLADLEPAVIHGGVPPRDFAPPGVVRFREAEIERFHVDRNCRVLIANPAACSEGVSLHNACHHAIFLDRTFNAGQFLQAQDRIHRLGLEKGQVTTFTILLSKNTIDEVIHSRVSEKIRRLQQLLGEKELTQLYLPTEEDASDLFDELDATAVLEHVHAKR